MWGLVACEIVAASGKRFMPFAEKKPIRSEKNAMQAGMGLAA